MKKLLASLVFLLVAAAASAQETYSISASANQVTDLALVVVAANERTCERLSLAESCTQAQACTAAGAAGGASCTAAQARAANARIWPATQAGREEFVTFVIVLPRFQDLKAGVVGRHREKLCAFWATATQTQKNTTCASVGQANGCELCPQ